MKPIRILLAAGLAGLCAIAGFASLPISAQQAVYSGFAALGGNNVFTAAGATSSPAATFNGIPFAGSATTSKALVLIEPSGGTSTGWGTVGSLLGINCGSTNNFLFNFQQNATARMSLTCGGSFTIPSGTNNWSGTYNFSSAVINFTSLFESTTAPGSGGLGGFGTTPLIVNPNGTAAFDINVGTGVISSTGTITMPSAAHHWSCKGTDATNPTTISTELVGTSATSITVYGFSRTTGLATAWSASDIIQITCTGV